MTIYVERMATQWFVTIAEADLVRSGLPSYAARVGRNIAPVSHAAVSQSAWRAIGRAIAWAMAACPDDFDRLREDG